MLLEKQIEEILVKHHEFFIEKGLELKARQFVVKGGRVDLVFVDRFGDDLLVEIKRGVVNRTHIAQLLDYLGLLTKDGSRVRLMVIAENVPANWKMALDRQGIEYREYTDKDYKTYLEKNDPTFGPTPEPLPPSICGLLSDFLTLRNFKAGEGMTEKSVEIWMQDRGRAKERYRDMFSPDNLEKMSESDFVSFLYFRNNRCWTQLYRQGLKLVNNMPALKKAISHLQEDELPIEDRLNDVLRGGSYWIHGFGINIATGILHICDTKEQYGVWNNRTEDALRKLHYLDRKIYNLGSMYLIINNYLHQLKSDLSKCRPEMNVNLELVDGFVWFVSKDKLDF